MKKLIVVTGLALVILGNALPVMAGPRPRPHPPMPMLAVQVLLDRAHFSVGVIDGNGGPNTDRAIAAFEKSRGVPAGDRAKLLDELGASTTEPVTAYAVTAEDVAGPFDPIPEDMMAKAALKKLGYTSALEGLAEKFHASADLLKQLNPHARFLEGEDIRVPNLLAPAEPAPLANAVITVCKQASVLTLTDAAGQTIFHAPVTTGSEHDPLPLGEWLVTVVVRNPSFNYNPDLFWDADPGQSKAKIPPGPNGPVGVVWIDITKPHYGIHGSPEPQAVGHTASHGCVRLTNWDAMTLAAMVQKGTKVVFVE